MIITTFLLLIILNTSQPVDVFHQANEAYLAGDYATAVTLYESMTASGYQDPNLYFNLGNAYFEMEDLGHALLNYRRAQQFIPRDRDLDRNLALVRALRVDVLSEETALIDSVAALTEPVMTTAELALVVFVLWTLWFALWGILFIRPSWQLRLRMWLFVVSAAMVCGSVLLTGRIFVNVQRPAAVITAFQAEAMSGPGMDYVPLFTLYSAAEGRVLERAEGWLRLLLPDGRQGWLYDGDVSIVGTG
jgi:tetratricopeptide (TPR) repeat protein